MLRSRNLQALGVCIGLLAPAAARAQVVPLADLVPLLECKADMASYIPFRRWISRGGAEVARAGYGWRRTQLFQAEYGLAHPVAALGLQVHAIGLTDNGVLAEVERTTPRAVAKRLGIDPMLDSGSMFLATKLVSANDAAKAHAGQAQVAPSDVDALLGVTPTRPAYDAQEIVQVVTNQGRPGKTMVGCNYISSAQSPNLPFPVK